MRAGDLLAKRLNKCIIGEIKGGKMAKKKKFLSGAVGAVIAFVNLLMPCNMASAFTVSPMTQEYNLVPGQSVTGEVSVVNASDAEEKFYYLAEVVPYSVSGGEDYTPDFDTRDDYTNIVNWVTLTDNDETDKEVVHGVLEPGEGTKMHYTIKVPQGARGGGQYFAVRVKTDTEAAKKREGEDTVVINEVMGIASVVFAEIAGDVTVKGEIVSNNIPSFLSNPPITASFVAKNEGNTHAVVTHYLQVFPLFSDEEVYTTEESPEKHYVLPGASRMITQTWDNAPAIGVFRVKQTVYYNSMDSEPSVTEKMVIICPIWLVLIVVFVIVGAIIWIVIRAKKRKKAFED